MALLLGWLSVFAAAMGFLEAIVVVYLRMIFYPDGFSFPLGALPPDMIIAELGREACTLIMLASVAALSGGSRMRRLGAFMYIFGLWDIFYYIALKLMLGWPRSLLTWDILFLMPAPWLGPVLAPLVVALTLCVFGSWLVATRGDVSVPRLSWALMLGGAGLVLSAFLWDYTAIILGGGFLLEYLTLFKNDVFMRMASSHVPESFRWGVFAAGEALAVAGMCWAVRVTGGQRKA
jgi:hypothetical protein